MKDQELSLLAEADRRAAAYLGSVETRRVFPTPEAITALTAFDEPLPEQGLDSVATLSLLDTVGSPATVTTNGPRYYGFVVGASLPGAAAEERLMIDPDRLPQLDDRTIVCLQAGEVNTGEFDPFADITPRAKAAGAWVHVDGAFGLWARVSPALRHWTDGADGADSWTLDGHKWLNTPYDCAMAICRDPDALAEAMNSDAVYAAGSKKAQKNLTLEFSRRPRGIPVWAALRTLGRSGVAALVERHCAQASRLAEGLRAAKFEVLNRVVLNQVLVRGRDDEETAEIRLAVERSGEAWFGPSVWGGRSAFRLSVSSWRTEDADIERLIDQLSRLRDERADALPPPISQ